MTLYLSLVVSFWNRSTKIRHQNLIWCVLKNNKGHIFTLEYYEFHIQVHSFQKVG